MLQKRNFRKLLLAALLLGAASTAIAWETCGINLQYEIDGTTLQFRSPDPSIPATIYSQAFINRTDIADIVFPENLAEISSEAFRGCLLVGSGNSLPKGGGENQTEAW